MLNLCYETKKYNFLSFLKIELALVVEIVVENKDQSRCISSAMIVDILVTQESKGIKSHSDNLIFPEYYGLNSSAPFY